MKQKIIGKGAEATIYLEDNQVKKQRISKSYRLPELDKKIIKHRTKAETKIINTNRTVIHLILAYVSIYWLYF